MAVSSCPSSPCRRIFRVISGHLVNFVNRLVVAVLHGRQIVQVVFGQRKFRHGRRFSVAGESSVSSAWLYSCVMVNANNLNKHGLDFLVVFGASVNAYFSAYSRSVSGRTVNRHGRLVSQRIGFNLEFFQAFVSDFVNGPHPNVKRRHRGDAGVNLTLRYQAQVKQILRQRYVVVLDQFVAVKVNVPAKAGLNVLPFGRSRLVSVVHAYRVRHVRLVNGTISGHFAGYALLAVRRPYVKRGSVVVHSYVNGGR